MAQIFVAFSEKLKFNKSHIWIVSFLHELLKYVFSMLAYWNNFGCIKDIGMFSYQEPQQYLTPFYYFVLKQVIFFCENGIRATSVKV